MIEPGHHRSRLRAPRPGRQPGPPLRPARRPVVLYFYPKADTPGCTTQACGIRDHRPTTTPPAATVLGVSPDPVKAVKKFHDKQALNFTLLADADHAVAEAYGVWVEKSMYGRTYWGAERATFIIDATGASPRHPEGLARRRTTTTSSRRSASSPRPSSPGQQPRPSRRRLSLGRTEAAPRRRRGPLEASRQWAAPIASQGRVDDLVVELDRALPHHEVDLLRSVCRWPTGTRKPGARRK